MVINVSVNGQGRHRLGPNPEHFERRVELQAIAVRDKSQASKSGGSHILSFLVELTLREIMSYVAERYLCEDSCP